MRLGPLLASLFIAFTLIMLLFNYTPVTFGGEFGVTLNVDEPDKLLLALIVAAAIYLAMSGRRRRRYM